MKKDKKIKEETTQIVTLEVTIITTDEPLTKEQIVKKVTKALSADKVDVKNEKIFVI